MKTATFATEADLCAAFIADAKGQGWTAYAETEGWDILLAAADGTQIGVQAKLRLNVKVLAQAIDDGWAMWRDEGPDFRAVLVPESGCDTICGALGLMLIHAMGSGGNFHPSIAQRGGYGGYRWHFWNPLRRHKLPDFVPDVAAGASGPTQLTKWKVAALRILARLEIRGHVTRLDFKELGIDIRRWVGPQGWLMPGAVPGQFVAGPGDRMMTRQHPDVWPQVLAYERKKALPRDLLEVAAA